MSGKAAKTRGKILEAAQQVVMRQGFAATSIDDIQAAADVSRGTIFYHFSSKDDIARELVRRYAKMDRDLTDGLMRRAEALSRDPLQQVLLFFRLHGEMFDGLETELPGCLFASYSYEAGLFDEETHEIIRASVDEWQEVVAAKLEAAFLRYPAALPVDARALADLGYGVMQGAFILSRVRGDPGLTSAHVTHFCNYLELLCGVAVTPAAD